MLRMHPTFSNTHSMGEKVSVLDLCSYVERSSETLNSCCQWISRSCLVKVASYLALFNSVYRMLVFWVSLSSFRPCRKFFKGMLPIITLSTICSLQHLQESIACVISWSWINALRERTGYRRTILQLGFPEWKSGQTGRCAFFRGYCSFPDSSLAFLIYLSGWTICLHTNFCLFHKQWHLIVVVLLTAITVLF